MAGVDLELFPPQRGPFYAWPRVAQPWLAGAWELIDRRMLRLGGRAPAPNGRIAEARTLRDAIEVLELLYAQEERQEGDG